MYEELLPPSERAKRLAGRTLDGYCLEGVLKGGEGGFGVVYSAKHPQLGKVAVKVLGVDARADSQAYRRFQREVKLLCEMGDAKHIVRIRHAGLVDDMLPWFAMDYIEGKPLDQWIGRTGKVKRDDLVTILSDILEGLHQVQGECRKRYARTRQSEIREPDRVQENEVSVNSVVHRDIKPGNVMVVEHKSGEIGAILIDFGIAGMFGEQMEGVVDPDISTPSMEAALHGAYTPEYRSPELCLSPKALSVQSDIFQVGLVAFEMMTGKRYWDVQPDAERILKTAKGWPWLLKRAISKALNWDPAKRHSSPAEFKRALDHPKRRIARSLLVRPKRLAVSILAISLVVSTVWLVMVSNQVSDLQQTNTGLKEQIVRLESRSPQASRGSVISSGGDSMLIKLNVRQIEICDKYDKFLADNTEDAFQALEQDCKLYKDMAANVSPEPAFLSTVNSLLAWMEKAQRGRIQILPKKFRENVWTYNSNVMRYRFKQGDKTCESEKCYFKDEQHLWEDEDSDRYPFLEVPWCPGGEKIYVEVEQIEDGEVAGSTVESWWMTGQIIRRSEKELSKEQELTLDDGKFKFQYTIKRVDFGPIPALPPK